MLELKEYKTPDGWNTVDTGITTDEWLQLLANEELIKEEYLKWILRFYREPGHQATCGQLAKKYKVHAQSVNSYITNCGKAIQKHLDRFIIKSDLAEGNHYVTILVKGKYSSKTADGFVFQIREELAKAIEQFLYNKLLELFKEWALPIGLGSQGIRELYKWPIITDCAGKTEVQILQRLIGSNLIDNQFDGAAIKKLLQSEPEDIGRCFSLLKGPREGLQTRYEQFRKETDALTKNRWKYIISDERMAGAFLACSDPEHYTFYKNDVYLSLCSYFGIQTRPAKRKLSHFYEIIDALLVQMEKDSELMAFFEKETTGYIQSPLLSAQTIAWYMQDYMNKQTAINTQYSWIPFVREMAEKLLEYKNKRDELVQIFYGIDRELTRAYQEDKEDLTDLTPFTVLGTLAVGKTERRNRFASYFKEKFGIKAEIPTDFVGFPSLHPQRVMFIFGKNKADYTEPFWELLEAAVNGQDISDMFNQVMSIKGTNRNVTMGLFWVAPKTFLSLDSTNENYLKHYGFPPIPSKAKINSNFYNNLMEEVKAKMETGEIIENDFLEFTANAYSFSGGAIYDIGLDDAMDEFITLLKSNYNLVLTGAPGTGKTYLAKQAACQIILGKKDFSNLTNDEETFFKEHCKLVQFHPSYDYSDFVEGLRPLVNDNSQMGFRRENGVIKTLCEAALLNLQEAAKSGYEQQEDQDVRARALEFIDIAIGESQSFETKTGKPFTVVSVDERAFYVSSPDVGAALIRVPFKDLFILLSHHLGKVTDIRALLGRKRTQQQDSYLFSIAEQIRQSDKTLIDPSLSEETPHTERVKRENFVLIIDEINRGELSKIFGELFYSIDPGYRGVSGRVQTQYQNLVEEDDVFYDGFYVPENVYIIGTMNDIDRGVESMDFAIRRRFGWYEVTVESRMEMLDERIPKWSDAAKRCMMSLNDALKEKSIGLTSAYDIGPAYFLKLEHYNGNFERLWDYHIKGIVTEYLRGTRGIEEKVNKLKEAFDAYKE